ncbi:MAG: divalent-cation tolerance protein CutA [Chloroflexi bacterium]|nr:divalent-cation tolerance protein CutA [Chloroflexota bacterium]
MTDLVQVVTTTPDVETAEALADLLVERRLAACVQILGPIRSVYRWRGRTERTREWLCLIKSERRLFPAIEQVIKQHHPYEVPEIVALPAAAAARAYHDWVAEEVLLGE